MFRNIHQKLQLLWILLLVGLLQVSVIQTQDATTMDSTEAEPIETDVIPTATELPAATPTLVSTEIPTEVSTDIPTEVPTEIPTDMPTEVVTEEPTDMPPVVETTAEVMPEETEEVLLETPEAVSGTEPIEETPTVDITEIVVPTEVDSITIPDEPQMRLLIREMFNNGDLSPWVVPADWSLVASDGGQALQVVNSTEPLTLQKGIFFNVAVQVRFAITSGDAQLHIQRGNAITLHALLDDSGVVTLSKNDDVLQTTTVVLDVTKTWHTLRLSIVDGVMRVAVDGDEIMVLVDGDALQAGGISISAGDDSSDEVINNQILVDDFFLWVPVSEADRYPSPTPMGAVTVAPAVVIVSTAVPTILPTESVEIKEESTGEEAVVVQPAVREVVVPLAIPNAPLLKSPEDGAVTDKTQEKLKWYRTRGETYLVDVDNDDDFSSPLYVDVLASSQFVPPTDLPQDTYYWRVQAQNLDGASAESDVWSFTVKIMSSPADGDVVFMRGTDTQSNVSLRWKKVKTATNYLLYLYDDPLCTSLMAGYPLDTGTSTSARILLDKGPYCWKVQAVGVDSGIPIGFNTFTVSPPALDAPELISPDKKDMTNDTTPTLDWEAVTDAVDYRVEWSTDRKFKTDVQSIIIHAPTTDYTLPTLPDTGGTRYYWQVAGMNDLGVVGKWSKPFDFTLDTVAPDIPILKSPEDGAVTSNPQDKFKWESADGASEYLVDMDNNDDFSSPLYEDSLASKQFAPLSDLPQDIYYWRVQAIDEAGNISGESDQWRITVNILTSPSDGEAVFMRGTATDSNVSLRWAKVKSATNFMLYLYDDVACTSLMAGYPLDMGTSTSARLVLDKGQYCWKVQAVGVDSGIPDIFSTFTVSPPALDAPVLVSPYKRSLTNDTTPTLDWEAVLGAVDYRIEWSTDRKFQTDVLSDVMDAAFTEYTLPTLPAADGTKYYWRIAAMSDLGVVGKWSKPFDFTLDTVPPDVPILTSPLDLATVNSSLPDFMWNQNRDVEQYEISLDTLDPPVVTDITTSNKYRPPAPLLLTDYYWRVRAIDEAGNVSDWSNAGDAWQVTISSQSLASPVLNRFATDNPSPMDLPPTLCWSPISWAEGYELQVDNHDDFSSPIYANDAIEYDTQCVTIDPLYDGTWYWQVRAIRAGENTNWSPTGTFTVES